MADHGRLFDQFPALHRSEHGGTQYDEGFAEQAIADPHGTRFDTGFPEAAELPNKYGERFDEFGWKDVPAGHGAQFDTDFSTALPDSPHGTWFDALDGAEVRFICNGVDMEGTVIQVKSDYAVVSTGASDVEVSLAQFLQYRSPALDNHSPGLPAETAEELPSARNETAHGAFDEARSTPSTGEKVDHVSPGPGNTDERTDAPAGLHETFDHLKTTVEELSVEKSAVPFKSEPTHGVGPGADHTVEDNPFNRQHAGNLIGKSFCVKHAPSYAKLGPAPKGAKCDHVDCGGTVRYGMHPAGANSWKTRAEYMLDILKDITSAETATQGDQQSQGSVVKHRKGCPRSGGGPCGSADGGKCSACQADVRDHEVIGKTAADPNGYIVNNGCQHCGKPMNPVDAMVGLQAHGKVVCHNCAAGLHKAAATGKPFKPQAWTDKSFADVLDVLKDTGGPVPNQQFDAPETSNSDSQIEQENSPEKKGKVPLAAGNEDIKVEQRGKPSDHNMPAGGEQRTCPHCGNVIAELNAKADQGAPTHKCLGTALDTLKTLVTA